MPAGIIASPKLQPRPGQVLGPMMGRGGGMSASGAPAAAPGGMVAPTPSNLIKPPTTSQWSPGPQIGVVDGAPQLNQYPQGIGFGGGDPMGILPTPSATAPPPMAAPRAAPPPSGGDPTPSAPPIDMGEITQMLKTLKGDPVPREPAPQALPRIAAPEPVAQSASKDLGFARYKDKSGRIGKSALRAMKDIMTERGISDSGIELDKNAEILTGVAQGQADNAYQQELEAERQAADFRKLGYQGDISQRANDMGLVGTGFSGGITQRGQDIQSNDLTNLFPSIASLLMAGRRY